MRNLTLPAVFFSPHCDFALFPFPGSRRFPEVKVLSELAHRSNLKFIRFQAQKADKKGLHTGGEQIAFKMQGPNLNIFRSTLTNFLFVSFRPCQPALLLCTAVPTPPAPSSRRVCLILCCRACIIADSMICWVSSASCWGWTLCTPEMLRTILVEFWRTSKSHANSCSRCPASPFTTLQPCSCCG